MSISTPRPRPPVGPTPAMNRWASIVLVASLLTSCGLLYFLIPESQPPTTDDARNTSRMYFTNGLAMGATYQIKAVVPAESSATDNLDAEILSFLRTFNTMFSTYDPESEVSRFNASNSTDWFPVSKEIVDLTQASLELSKASDGAYDITIGPLLDLWSFGPNKRPKKVPTDEQIEAARKFVGFQKLELRTEPPAIRKTIPELKIDFNSIAPGFAVDLMAKMLEDRGLTDYLIEVGGEIRVRGEKRPGTPWTIAIEKPESDQHAEEYQRKLPLKDISVTTSGDYRNYFEENGVRYSHTIDPATGRPISHKLVSVTVLHETCTMADGLSTVLMVLGPEKGYQWAVRQNLAIHMMIKADQGIEELSSPRFQEMFDTPSPSRTADE